jgi:hypothetical protein
LSILIITGTRAGYDVIPPSQQAMLPVPHF